MRHSIIISALAGATALLGSYGSASAQAVGVQIYVGPPVYGYGPGPGPYMQSGPAYTYDGYADPDLIVTYPRRIRCGSHRFWDGNHCADLDSFGVGQP